MRRNMSGRRHKPLKSYPNRLLELRERMEHALGRRVPRREIAAAAGITAKKLEHYELGGVRLPVELLPRLAAALGVTPAEILNAPLPPRAAADRDLLALFHAMPAAEQEHLLNIAHALTPAPTPAPGPAIPAKPARRRA